MVERTVVAPGWNPGLAVLAVRDRLDRGIERIVSSTRWTWWTALVGFVVGMVLATPDPAQVKTSGQWRFIIAHSRGDLFDPNVGPTSRNANVTFRIVPRLVGKLLHLGQPWHFYAIQVAFGFVMLVVIARLLEEVLRDRHAAVVGAIGTAGLWAVACSWTEVRGNFDAAALAFVLIAMLVRRPPLVLLAGLAGTFTDERAIFVLPLVALWQLLRDQEAGEDAPSVRTVGTAAWIAAAAAILAGFLHVAIRLALTQRYGLHEGKNHSPGNPWAQLNNYPNGLWGALEGYWLVAAAGLIGLVRAGRRMVVVLALGSVAFTLLIGVSVFDMSRSVMFVFPLVPLALLGLRGVDRAWLRGLMWVGAVVSLVWPLLYAADDRTVVWAYPLPFLLAHKLGFG